MPVDCPFDSDRVHADCASSEFAYTVRGISRGNCRPDAVVECDIDRSTGVAASLSYFAGAAVVPPP